MTTFDDTKVTHVGVGTEAEDTAPVPTDSINPSTDEPKPCLVVTVGSDIGRVIFIDERITIGRGDADLRIEDPTISRLHACVFRDDEGRLRVRDLGSTNGTFVNGRITLEQEILAGDRIQVGRNVVMRLDFRGRCEVEPE